MKFTTPRWVLYPLLLSAGAAALPAATPVIGTQLFQETNARIEDLYQHRDHPPKPLGPVDNLFRIPETALVANAGPGDSKGPPLPEVTPPSSDEAMLRRAVSTMAFGGFLQIGDREVVVINKQSYREGGILTLRVDGAPVYLRIVSITGNSITLGLNDARLTLHF